MIDIFLLYSFEPTAKLSEQDLHLTNSLQLHRYKVPTSCQERSPQESLSISSCRFKRTYSTRLLFDTSVSGHENIIVEFPRKREVCVCARVCVCMHACVRVRVRVHACVLLQTRSCTESRACVGESNRDKRMRQGEKLGGREGRVRGGKKGRDRREDWGREAGEKNQKNGFASYASHT